MRRSVYAVSLALKAVLLASCMPSAGTDGATPEGPTSSAPTPAPSASESAEGSDDDDPSTWVVSEAGMGPLKLGMPFADAVVAVPGFEEACGDAFHREFGDSSQSVWLADSGGSLGVVESAVVDGPLTSDGIGVGSTTADVLAAYPDATVDVRNLAYLRVGTMFFGYRSDVSYDSDGAQYVADDLPEDIVSVGVTSADVPWEYCG